MATLKLAHLVNGKLSFHRAEIWEFIAKCNSVNEKLALFVYFTSGQTPHVSEFIEHKYANSTKPQTMFRDFDSLWLAICRVNSESVLEKKTFLPINKCHPELTEILQHYKIIKEKMQ